MTTGAARIRACGAAGWQTFRLGTLANALQHEDATAALEAAHQGVGIGELWPEPMPQQAGEGAPARVEVLDEAAFSAAYNERLTLGVAALDRLVTATLSRCGGLLVGAIVAGGSARSTITAGAPHRRRLDATARRPSAARLDARA